MPSLKICKQNNMSGWNISGRYLGKKIGNMMGNLSKKAFLDLSVPLAKDVLPNLETKANLSILDIFEREIRGKGSLRAGKNSLYSFQMKI